MSSNHSPNADNNTNEKLKLVHQEGEFVLCYHGPLLYEAKCMKAEIKNKTAEYLIHYNGWNKSWDEWVPANRVLKMSDENLKLQKELLATHGTSKILSKIRSNSRKSIINITSQLQTGDANDKSPSGSTGASGEVSDVTEKPKKGENNTSSASLASPLSSQMVRNNSTASNSNALGASGLTSNVQTPTSDARRNKRQKTSDGSTNDLDENYTVKNEVYIKIAEELRQLLVEDHIAITSANKLVSFPSNKSVETILDDYLSHKLEQQFDKNVIGATVNALKDYFNAVLPTKLLYKQERAQYAEWAKSSKKKPSHVYGSIHLLRLLAKIGNYLSYVYWDEICIKQLILQIEDVIKYLVEYRSTIFSPKCYVSITVTST